MHIPNKSGFTLIELSVVLVIIGLLVGGILVGQDLLVAAKVRGQMKQIQDLQTQVATFQAKYDCLPGDCPNATTLFGATDAAGHTVSNGDGDGLIRSTLGGGAPYPAGECVLGGIQGTELPQVYLQLNDGNVGQYISDGTGNTMQTGWGANQVIDNGTGVLLTCLGDPVNGFNPLDPALKGYNVIVIGSWANNTTPSNRIQYITGMINYNVSGYTSPPLGIPIDYARMIDQKMDDGSPAKGAVGVIGAPGTNAYNPGTCLTNSNKTYPPPTTTCTATLGIRLGL